MTMRAQVTKGIARTVQKALKRWTSGGTSFPGKLAKALDPAILKTLAKDYRVVVITGTNGKTVTTGLTVNILRQRYAHVLTNDTGSNMEQGIISTFLQAESDKKEDKIAVLEVDEASVRHVTRYIQPEVILTTNLFRDQMDRFGEIYTTFDYILEGADQVPDTLLMMNGDAPIFSSRAYQHKVSYFGFRNEDKTKDLMAHYNTDGVLCPNCQHILHYHAITYSNLGDYFCPNCSFKRPELSYEVERVDELTTESASFTIEGHTYTIPVAGVYNIYNALAAYSLAKYFGLSQEEIQEGLGQAKRIFGRQEKLTLADKDVRINLIKNPVGFNQIVSLLALDSEDFSLVILLNDRSADGEDISWIWDGLFEDLVHLSQLRAVTIGGLRRLDLFTRVKVAGYPKEAIHVVENYPETLEAIKNMPTQKVYVLATYTAMLGIRRELSDQGLVKERMKS